MTFGNKAAWLFAFIFVTPAFGQAPSVTLNFGSISGGLDDATVTDTTITYGGELTVKADRLQGNILRQNYVAAGHVRVHDADTTLTANSLDFQGQQDQGTAVGAVLTRRPFTVRAAEIDIKSDTLEANQGSLTTAPPDTRPDLEARFQDLSLFPQTHKGVLRDVSLYLLHTRVVTVPRVSFSFGNRSGSNRRQSVLPAVGVSGRYGPFLSYGGSFSLPVPLHYSVLLPAHQSPQIRLTGQQTLWAPVIRTVPPQLSLVKHDYLGALRLLAVIPPAPLPEGDPLRFHNYLPEADNIQTFDALPSSALRLNEEISTHIEASGRRRNDLYVYRLPEIRLSGLLPLSAATAAPLGDAAAFRQFLRHLVIVAHASVAYGDYEEHPDHINATRQQDSLGFTTRPLLIAPNTLFQPRITYTSNFYSGRQESYRYLQLGAEIDHYFTSYSAVGMQYIGASTSGDSPFNFDVLDTPRELTIRVQVGNRRLAVGGQMRFDLTNGGIYDYKLAIAPGLNGITPVVSYNFRNRSVGFGAEIPGLTF